MIPHLKSSIPHRINYPITEKKRVKQLAFFVEYNDKKKSSNELYFFNYLDRMKPPTPKKFFIDLDNYIINII